MLSEREERELLLIEEGLRDDGLFAFAFPTARRPLHRRRWVVRTAIAFGLVLILAGLALEVAAATPLRLEEAGARRTGGPALVGLPAGLLTATEVRVPAVREG